MSLIPSGPRTVIVTCLVFLSVALAFPVAQQSPPKFRSGVEAVVFDVTVLGRDRQPVRGLTAADFTILEDGKPQAIQTFSAVDLEDVVEPVPAGWRRDVAPDVRKNDEFREHRVVVIVLDDSTPMPGGYMGAGDVLLAKQLGRVAVDQLAPDDLAAVVYTFNQSAGQVFTKDRTRLRAAVDRFNAPQEDRKPFNAYDTINETLYRLSLIALRGIAEQMADLPQRRKAIIFVSVGLPLDYSLVSEPKVSEDGDAGNQIQSMVRTLHEIFEAARRANVSIYAADPGHLRAQRTTLNHDFLKAVSEATGGFPIVDTNEPAPGIAQVYRENSSYYLLGYQPANNRTEGRFRKVEVRVSRPGVMVRTRNGYVEPRAEKKVTKPAAVSGPPPLTTALLGVVPMADIPLEMTAAPFARTTDNQADVAIAVGATERRPVGTAATTDDVDVLVHAYDMKGRLRASERSTVRLAFRVAGDESVRYGLLSRLTLDPGRYQLRLVVRSSLLGKSGSVYYDLEVPDFSKPALSLSGVVLDVTPPVLSAPRGKLSAILPTVPTAQREFIAGEEVGAFLRVYQGGKGPLSPVVVTTRVVDGRDTEVFSKTDTLGQDRFGPARAADYRVSLPMADLTKGPHLLRIAVTRGKTAAQREVRFTVR